MHGLDIGFMLDAAHTALGNMLSIHRMVALWAGVMVGLAIGLLPGIGGLTGFALLVPFTYTMDPISAFAMLLGMHSVTSTSDVIPAVLFGVPGTAASQATVLDGLQMTKKGEAGRALSASYCASLIGGIFGALVLAVSVPVIRPFVLAIGTPELLAMTVFGIAMVSSLSGTTPLRGIIAACFGILCGMIGTDDQTGTVRWAGDVLYLWDGLPMLPVLLGLFALPELCDIAVSRKSVADEMLKFSHKEGMLKGAGDCLRNWFLILRCSSIGSLLGLIPGITGSVTDWIAYGHALRTEKGAAETFTKGDVRGVIAPESANNAKEGGSLIPTIAFGVPGSAAQAVLLGALMVHGFVPGPAMLTTHLDVTYTLVWSIALANIFGAGVCYLMSGYFARISMLRHTLLLPAIMAIIFIGAFQGSGSWGDFYTLLIFGALGWAMKRLGWPRPPLILGLVLGSLIERYMAISIQRFDWMWLGRPVVILLLALALIVLVRPLWTQLRQGRTAFVPLRQISFRAADLLYLPFLGIGAWMLIAAQQWPFGARIGPTVVASALLVAGVLSLGATLLSDRGARPVRPGAAGLHMDLKSDDGGIGPGRILARAGMFFGWFVAFLILTGLIGLVPTVPLIILAYMRVEGREPWRLSLAYAACVTLLVYVVFDQIIHVPWPNTWLGGTYPQLAALVPSM